jgi:hypothetical protein
LKDISGKFIRRAVLLTVGIIALVYYPAMWWLGDDAVRSLIIGASISALVMSISFASLVWSFDKSNQTFMTTYAVGFLGRMLVLGGSVLIISRIDSLNLIAGSLAILFVYLVLTGLEIKYIQSYRPFQRIGDGGR